MNYHDFFKHIKTGTGVEFEIYSSMEEMRKSEFSLCMAVVSEDEIRHLIIMKNSRVLAELPAFIDVLKNLTSLDISCNNLTELPALIGELSNLTSLSICNNNLDELPASIGELKALSSLDISNNPLTELPEWLGNLRNLTCLNLSELTIPKIPKSIAYLGLNFIFDENQIGNGINLFRTKLLNMDISLFEQPLSFIQAFYEGDEDENLVEINECKIIFLGDGEVGKTSLIERIVDPEKKLKDMLPTYGISITNYQKNISGKEVKLRIWDFGGQEIMHSMHKCFLTTRTVYVVVLNARQNQFLTQNALYWLETVNAFAPECPVVLVINKIDLAKDAAVNEAELKRMYPNLQLQVAKTSATESLGINILKNCIDEAIKNKNLYIDDFKKSWLPIKEKLENMVIMKTPYIDNIEYTRICENEKVCDSSIQKNLLRWFKEKGISYFYEGSEMNFASRDITVLNPEWLTGGIYRLIINSEAGNGFINRSTIESILGKIHENDVTQRKYKGREIDFVLNVMEQFEISYKYQDMEFIPLKLPDDTPETEKFFDKTSALHLTWEAEYIPSNAIHRLMIRMFDEMDQDCVWLYGAKCGNYDGKKTALVYMEITKKVIHVFTNSAKPDEKKEYLSIIRDKLNEIFMKLNLKCAEYIHYLIDGEEGKVEYAYVLDQYYDGIRKIYLKAGEKKHYTDPKVLLHQVYTERDIKEGAATMNIKNRDGNVIVVYGNDNETNQETGDKTNYVNWVKKLPSEESVTEEQIKDLQAVLEAFTKSEAYQQMTVAEADPLRSALEESQKLPEKETKWKKLKSFLSSAGNSIISKIEKFLKEYPYTAKWIKELFVPKS